jgi:hypothetical protein
VFLAENEQEEDKECNSSRECDDDNLEPSRERVVVVGIGEVQVSYGGRRSGC